MVLRPDITAAEAVAAAEDLLGAGALAAGLDARAELGWLLLCELSDAAGCGLDDADPDTDDAGPDAPEASPARLFYALAPTYEQARDYYAAHPSGTGFEAFRASRSAAFEPLWNNLHPPVELLLETPLSPAAAAHVEGPLVCLWCRRRADQARVDASLPDAAPVLAAASPPTHDGAELWVRPHSSAAPVLVRYFADAGYLRCFVAPDPAAELASAEYRLEFSFGDGTELSGTCAYPRDSFGGVNVGALRGIVVDDLISVRVVQL
ncbi:MAG: hypothetical protein H6744_02955 [Deltaproteobacteria bacterium]|nr:hypothetical protein [Deltaproteobacteria bacterium]MCB9785633.1 hypothetical protein [Deltaproteobacteria bacterium]